ncbi:alpha/beta hydrolase family protein [Leifsonia sp. NPDC102414]|uniref:alpha/beta hydrolase family protein n=1 Tax=Leifsonia sp. NPDC102414 TaxID=3364124 RepID=UPI0038053712
MIVLIILPSVGLVVIVSAIAVLLARRVIGDRKRSATPILWDTGDSITVRATARTLAPGIFALVLADGAKAIVGPILESTLQTVTRKVVCRVGVFRDEASAAAWTGEILDASDLGKLDDVSICTPHGTAQAWVIHPAVRGEPDTWAIHIHGLRSSREGALRSVPAASALGMTSLVISFTGHHAQAGRRPSATLGIRESDDVLAAVEFAVTHGARRVVLFGWSMGATAALLASECETRGALIAGLVLVGPATTWPNILRHAVRRAGLPGIFGAMTMLALRAPALRQLAGAPQPIDMRSLDWSISKRLGVPALVLHSPGDGDIPLRFSERFVSAQAPDATLIVLPPAPHCAEYNVDPTAFNTAIIDWWNNLPK